MEENSDTVDVNISVLPISIEKLHELKTDLVLFAKSELQDPTKWMMLIPKVCEIVESIKVEGKKLSGSDKKSVTIALFNIVMKDAFSVDEDYTSGIINLVDISIDTVIDVSKGKFKINTKCVLEFVKRFLSCFIKI